MIKKIKQTFISGLINRNNTYKCVSSVMMELLSHFGCDLLSFLAVSVQVFDLHRQRAVPHHQHRLLV